MSIRQEMGGSAPNTSQAPNLSGNLFSKYYQYGVFGLAQPHKDYCEAVKKQNEGYLPGLECRILERPSNSVSFEWTDQAGAKFSYIVIFETAVQKDIQNFTPVSDLIAIARSTVQQRSPGIKCVNSILINDNDLNRVMQMALNIRTLMLSLSQKMQAQAKGSDAFTANDLSAGSQFKIENSKEEAIAFIDRWSPVSLKPRCDYGFVMTMSEDNQNNLYGQNQEPGTPVLAVTMYTEILGPDMSTGTPRFMPVIHITSIVSQIPSQSSIYLGLIGAVQQAIIKQVWKSPFMTFKKGEPNIGSLFPDGKGKCEFINDPNLFQRTINSNSFSQPPAIALDVADGAYRIPATCLFTEGPEGQNALVDGARRFFGANNVDPAMMTPGLLIPYCQQYIGRIGEGVFEDSRWISYLNVSAKTPVDSNTRDILLYAQVNPVLRARATHNIAPSFASLYRNDVVLLTPEFLVLLSNMRKSSKMRIIDPNQSTVNIPLRMLDFQNANYNNFFQFGSNPAQANAGTNMASNQYYTL